MFIVYILGWGNRKIAKSQKKNKSHEIAMKSHQISTNRNTFHYYKRVRVKDQLNYGIMHRILRFFFFF